MEIKKSMKEDDYVFNIKGINVASRQHQDDSEQHKVYAGLY
jgi:hypothetical protein